MIVDRRTFIVRTALGATAAGLANLLPLSPTAQAHATPLPVTLPVGETDRNCMVFKINGWDCDDLAMDASNRASANSLTNDPAGDKVLIRISQSWRTTWR
jgi:hypothetical protein